MGVRCGCSGGVLGVGEFEVEEEYRIAGAVLEVCFDISGLRLWDQLPLAGEAGAD